MITIKLNSKAITVTELLTVKEVLDAHGFVAGHFAIAVNRQFIPRKAYENTRIHEGDEIDVVTPMQGG